MNDKRLSIILTIICAVLMAIATVYAAVTAADSVPEAEPPVVNTEGLCVHEPVYKMYFTDADVVAVAKMLYGESRGCSIDNQQNKARQRSWTWCHQVPPGARKKKSASPPIPSTAPVSPSNSNQMQKGKSTWMHRHFLADNIRTTFS